MPQSYAAIYHHFVFSTKERVAIIDAPLQTRLYEFIGGLCKHRNSRLLFAGGMPDHVHLLVSLDKEWAPSPFMREIKGNSSKWIHETFPSQKHFAWQAGYGAFSVGHLELQSVKQYIAGQAEHHKIKTFQDEFRELLERHNIPYDERYIWA